MPSNPKNVRRCVCCNGRSDKSEMLRFVKTADGRVILDSTQKADGRGVWLHDSEECIAKAKKRKLLGPAFKMNAQEDVYECF